MCDKSWSMITFNFRSKRRRRKKSVGVLCCFGQKLERVCNTVSWNISYKTKSLSILFIWCIRIGSDNKTKIRIAGFTWIETICVVYTRNPCYIRWYFKCRWVVYRWAMRATSLTYMNKYVVEHIHIDIWISGFFLKNKI